MKAFARSGFAVVVLVGWVCGGSPVLAAAPNSSSHDPLESVNRKIFWFNNQIDDYVLAPVATVWDKIMPQRVEKCLSNFFGNLRFPIVAGNGLLQGKFKQAGSDVGRFAVNTTIGLAGFFDPASGWGLEEHNEDFGQTLGYWGVGAGPYLVLPFFGPSNPRDTVGLAADSFSTVYPFFVEFIYLAAARGTDIINARAMVLQEVREFKAASFDYYVAVRNAYIQRRKALIADRSGVSAQESEDLYTIQDNNGESEP
jgi:phospholipid-binding lipoprotein MlaA